MIFRFDDHEVDTDTREVRRQGELQPLQPQAFAVLAYLLTHRGRAVPKSELLAELWPDVTVGEGSLQRAISHARAALADDGRCIRTIPRHGYRFAGSVTEVDPRRAPTAQGSFMPRFARSGDVHVAYHTVGEGPVDIVVIGGWSFPMKSLLDPPLAPGFVEGLGEIGRVVLFDKRGTGLSDRVKSLPTLQERMDDLRAVLDAVGSTHAVLVGMSEGAPLAILFATTYPDRARGLVLVGGFARWAVAPDYPWGWSPEQVSRLRGYIARSWGAGSTIHAVVASRPNDPDVAAWCARAEQQGASPGAAIELLEMNLSVDVRALLGSVRQPAIVLVHSRDPVIHPGNGRFLAEHMPHAELREVDGIDHAFMFEGRADLKAALRDMVSKAEAPAEPERRYLATVMAVSGSAGDALDAVAAAHGGRRAGPDLIAFDGPQRALEAGRALVVSAPVAVGVHIGEVSESGGRLQGAAVDVAGRLAAATSEGTVCLTRIVRDLVHGSDLRFRAPEAVGIEGIEALILADETA